MNVTTEQVHAHLKYALKLDPEAVHVTEVADVSNCAWWLAAHWSTSPSTG